MWLTKINLAISLIFNYLKLKPFVQYLMLNTWWLHYYLNPMQILSYFVVVLIQTQTSYLLYQSNDIHFRYIENDTFLLLIDGEYHNCMQISNNCLFAIYDWILTFTWYISLTHDFCYTVVKLHRQKHLRPHTVWHE